MKKSIFTIIVLMGLVIYGVYDHYGRKQAGSTVEQQAQEGIHKGQHAPDFELKDLQSKTVKLSDFKGKKVLINFWATWCPPCRMEMPHMQKFYEDYSSQGVVILGINITATEQSPDAAIPFAKKYGLTYPIVLDENGTTMDKYQVTAYPTTYVVDSQGIIREVFQGAINYNIMKDEISKIK